MVRAQRHTKELRNIYTQCVKTFKKAFYDVNTPLNIMKLTRLNEYLKRQNECTVRQKKKERKRRQNTSIYTNINYRREMKLVPIIMYYCLLQFDALKFFLGVRLHGGLNLTLIFSM